METATTSCSCLSLHRTYFHAKPSPKKIQFPEYLSWQLLYLIIRAIIINERVKWPLQYDAAQNSIWDALFYFYACFWPEDFAVTRHKTTMIRPKRQTRVKDPKSCNWSLNAAATQRPRGGHFEPLITRFECNTNRRPHDHQLLNISSSTVYLVIPVPRSVGLIMI